MKSKLSAISILFIVLAVLSVLAGTVFSMLKYQEMESARDEYSAAQETAMEALQTLNWAEGTESDAWSDYNWCVWWCIDELTYWSSTVELVDVAQASYDDAVAAEEEAQYILDEAAASFNLVVLISLVGGGALIVAAIILSVVSLRKSRTNKGMEADSALENPTWYCVDCGVKNDSGLFCIECGHSKSDSKAGAMTNPAPDVPTAPTEKSLDE